MQVRLASSPHTGLWKKSAYECHGGIHPLGDWERLLPVVLHAWRDAGGTRVLLGHVFCLQILLEDCYLFAESLVNLKFEETMSI